MKYRPDIDGLRALAVLPVVAFHTGLGLSGGFVGVDIFFVISGFLITSIIFDEAKTNSFSIVGFYERRIRRIIPALFVVIFVTAIAAYALMIPSHLDDFAKSAIASALFFANIWQYLSQGYFTEAAELKPLLHTWSLGIEEQFYIFFPPLFVLLFKHRGAGEAAIWLAAAGSISLMLSAWAVANNPDAAFYLPQYRIWELILGALLALAIAEGWLEKFLRRSVPLSRPLTCWVCFDHLVGCQFWPRNAVSGARRACAMFRCSGVDCQRHLFANANIAHSRPRTLRLRRKNLLFPLSLALASDFSLFLCQR